ncbi:hydrogenase maturation protease [Thiohalorhabdus sp.]|uniref:hydrogenase maturation protease n=1 Tax=Thiohalorhabdus sp. TaxID=3094134 RepID=UPI002FC3846E
MAPDPLGSEPPTPLILGLGNSLREDEGAGLHVIRYLESDSDLPSGVRLMDGGTGGLHLVGEVADSRELVVVDAAELGAEPGTVRLLAHAELDGFVNRPSGWNVHDVGLPDLFAAAALMPEGLPERRAVVAVQPASFSWSERPSAPVTAAVPEAARLVREQVSRWRFGQAPAEAGS